MRACGSTGHGPSTDDGRDPRRRRHLRGARLATTCSSTASPCGSPGASMPRTGDGPRLRRRTPSRSVPSSATSRPRRRRAHDPARVVLVSNEVGSGVVPEHASGRLYRDLLGRSTPASPRSATRSTSSSPAGCWHCEPRQNPSSGAPPVTAELDLDSLAARVELPTPRRGPLPPTGRPGSRSRPARSAASRSCRFLALLGAGRVPASSARPRARRGVRGRPRRRAHRRATSAYPPEVTAQMVLNFLAGGAGGERARAPQRRDRARGRHGRRRRLRRPRARRSPTTSYATRCAAARARSTAGTP